MTREDFFKKRNHAVAYSKFMLIDIDENTLINEINKIDPNIIVSSGSIGKRSITFEIDKISPVFIHTLTARLNTIGYADTSWDNYLIVCSKNGKTYDKYTASLNPDTFYYRGYYDDGDDTWDAFIQIKDSVSGEIFESGAGAVDENTMLFYKNFVENHSNVLNPKKLVIENDLHKTHNIINNIINCREKLGETFINAYEITDLNTATIGSAIYQAINSCKKEEDLNLINILLKGLCGYDIKAILDTINELDERQHNWLSC